VQFIFISAVNLGYPARSDDPIFPARKHIDEVDMWIDDRPHPSVLGCVELAEICPSENPVPGECSNPWGETYENRTTWMNWDTREEAFLVWSGILHSSFGATLDTLRGFHLDATRRITFNRLSLALDPEQWKLEVRRLFDMAMLRIKIEMLYVVRGSRASEPGFEKLMVTALEGSCRKYKFPAQGHKNLSFMGILFATLGPLLMGLSIAERPPIAWIMIGTWRILDCAIFNMLRATRAIFHYFRVCVHRLREKFRQLP
jgi:hypothetical protein